MTSSRERAESGMTDKTCAAILGAIHGALAVIAGVASVLFWESGCYGWASLGGFEILWCLVVVWWCCKR